MELIFASIAVLIAADFLLPLRRQRRARASAEFEESYRLFKLKVVRQYYDCLSELSYSEIEKNYDVDEAYHRIGRNLRLR